MPLKTPSPKQFWIIAASLVCVAGISAIVVAFNPFGRSAPKDRPEIVAESLYSPAIVFGNPKAKNRILLQWSPGTRESLKLFIDLIWPLVRDEVPSKPGQKLPPVSKKNYSVVLYQMPDSRNSWNVGVGAALLCPDKQADYANVAFNYLAIAAAAEQPKSRPWGTSGRLIYEIDDQIMKAYQWAKLPNPLETKCFDKRSFGLRLIPYLSQGEYDRAHGQDAPSLFVNGRRLEKPTDTALQAALK